MFASGAIARAGEMRWLRRWAWLACALPLVLSLGLRARPVPAAASLLQELPAIPLGAGIDGHASGVDRRGAVVAVHTVDGRLHRVRSEAGRFGTESFAIVPRAIDPLQGPVLVYDDVDCDGLLELLIQDRCVDQPVRERWRVFPGWRDDPVPAAAVAATTVHGSPGGLGECALAGRRLTFAGLTRPGTPRCRTRLVDPATGRAVGLLDGSLLQVGDFDGDGGDDLLTAEGTPQPGEVLLRLYLGGDDRFHLAGEVRYQQGDLPGKPGGWTDCADLDADGRLELFAYEASPARIRLWRVRADDAPPT